MKMHATHGTTKRAMDPDTCWPTRKPGQTLPRPLRDRYPDLVNWRTVERQVLGHLYLLNAIVELKAEIERKRQLAIVHRPTHPYAAGPWSRDRSWA